MMVNTENQCLGGKDVRHALITAGSKGLGRKVTEAVARKRIFRDGELQTG